MSTFFNMGSTLEPPRSNGKIDPATIAVPLPRRKAKLTGRAFYESIGSPKMILAPMVDQSEFVRFPCDLHVMICAKYLF